jgi:3-phenylpropionate/cinnamic acid dioxygenase small subunit
MAEVASMTKNKRSAVKMARAEAEEFLFREAALIDQRRFSDWLEMFSADGRYWVPANSFDINPRDHVSLINDSRARLEDRVFRLGLTTMYSQNPLSRTVHMISNVQVGADQKDQVVVNSCFLIGSVREGDWRQNGLGIDSQPMFFGRYEHTLRHESGHWRILLKKVLLLQNDIPVGNITFLL